MTGWVAFEGRVVPMPWGRATYTILPVPDQAAQALAPARRVMGEIAEHPVNLALTRAPVWAGPFLWAGQSLLDRIGIAVGEAVEVRLRPAPDDLVDTPPDLAALLAGAGLTAAWQALTPGRQRGLLYRIDTARTAPTRDRRLAEVLAALEAGVDPSRGGG